MEDGEDCLPDVSSRMVGPPLKCRNAMSQWEARISGKDGATALPVIRAILEWFPAVYDRSCLCPPNLQGCKVPIAVRYALIDDE